MSKLNRELSEFDIPGDHADGVDLAPKGMLARKLKQDGEGLAEIVARMGEAMEQDYIQDMTGRLIGGYQVLRHLGTGGMSTVFLAECVHSHGKVAIKILRGVCSGVLLHRFLREQEILATLNHPCIASLLDGGLSSDGFPYAVMEYVNGEPIDIYCRKNQLGLADRLTLFIRVCEAVQHAHQNKIVHRDLKPGNILVTPDGDPMILDFGIAKTLDFEAGPMLTDPGRPPMTPGYASPEQFRGSSVASTSDTYSLGMLLYELLTGHHPFLRPGSPTLDMERAALEFDLEKPSTLVREIGAGKGLSFSTSLAQQLSGDLDNIVLKATQREPERRYVSVQVLADDLGCYKRGEPVTARGKLLGRRMRYLFTRYGKTGKYLAIVSLLSIGIVTDKYLIQKEAEMPSYAESKLEPKQVTPHLTG